MNILVDIYNRATSTVDYLDHKLVLDASQFNCPNTDWNHWGATFLSRGALYYCQIRNYFSGMAGGQSCGLTPGTWPGYGLTGNSSGSIPPQIDALKTQIVTINEFIDVVQGTPNDASSTDWLAADTQIRASDCTGIGTDYAPYLLTSCVAGWGGTVQQTQQLVDATQDLLASTISPPTNQSRSMFDRAKNANCNDGGKPQ